MYSYIFLLIECLSHSQRWQYKWRFITSS